MALFEAELNLELVATPDVDVKANHTSPIKKLIRAFLAQGASDRFFSLAEEYNVDLEQFS